LIRLAGTVTDQMAVILAQKDSARWLDADNRDTASLKQLVAAEPRRLTHRMAGQPGTQQPPARSPGLCGESQLTTAVSEGRSCDLAALWMNMPEQRQPGSHQG
jgi:hypothetical protein